VLRASPSPSDGAPVHAGHVQIQQDELGALASQELHRFSAAGHADGFFTEV
jgi:hypothetical protein